MGKIILWNTKPFDVAQNNRIKSRSLKFDTDLFRVLVMMVNRIMGNYGCTMRRENVTKML